MADYKLLVSGDVHAGEALPELSYDVSASTVVLGALATRDWRPMHHDKDFAQKRNGVQDIFLNTPSQAAWFERYVTDWTGPRGRLARMKFRMRDSVFPGDTMRLNATVTEMERDAAGCHFANLEVTLRVGDRVCTTCTARVAIPSDANDNPWSRKGEDWQP